MALTSETEVRQREYYDRIAEVYDRHYYHPHALAYRHGLYEGILKGIDLRGKEVLDAMCGGGESTAFFLEHGARVTGTDISPQQCSIYQGRFPSCPITCSSLLKTQYQDESFDFVVVDSLHHLHPKVSDGVREVVRILKPGGHLLIWEPVAGSALDLLRKLWYRLDRKYFENNERSIDVKNLLGQSGGQLKLIQARYGGNVGYLLVATSMLFRIPPKLVGFSGPALTGIDRLLSVVQPRCLSCWVLALMQRV